MGLFDSIFGDGGVKEAKGLYDKASREGKSEMDSSISSARAERSAILGALNRTISEARILGRQSDRMEDTGNFTAVRDRAAAVRRRGEAGAGLGGAGALQLSAADRGMIATAMDASSSAELRRRKATLDVIGSLQTQAGQLSVAGSNAEISAVTGYASQKIDAATRLGSAIIEAESAQRAAMMSAVGGAISGFAMGGFGDKITSLFGGAPAKETFASGRIKFPD